MSEEKKKGLWELTEDFLAVERVLEETGGELTPEIQTLLPLTREALMTKGDSFISYLRKLGSDLKILKEEKERIEGLRKTAENKEKNLKSYLKNLMEYHKLDSIDFVKSGARLQNNPKSVEIEDEKLIPAKYMIPQPAEPNKEAIKEALK